MGERSKKGKNKRIINKKIYTMNLSELTEKVYAEGVEKGNAKAAEIVAKAQEEAAAIVAKAEKEAAEKSLQLRLKWQSWIRTLVPS